MTFSKSRFMGHFSVFQTQSRHVAEISDIEGSMFRVAQVPRRDHNVSKISRERMADRLISFARCCVEVGEALGLHVTHKIMEIARRTHGGGGRVFALASAFKTILMRGPLQTCLPTLQQFLLRACVMFVARIPPGFPRPLCTIKNDTQDSPHIICRPCGAGSRGQKLA